jgi:arylsulfatase A-like enzyme
MHSRPNFLFIVADDLNAWLGCLGRHPDAKTPHIDRLASRGSLFVNAYCSAPYCNASRMGVFTGCLPATTGIYHSEPLWDVPDRRITFTERLRESGYYTFGAGKVFHGVFDYATAGREKRTEAGWVEVENRGFLWDGFRSNRIEPLPDDRPLNRLFDFSEFDTVPPMYHHFDWGPIGDEREAEMPDAEVLRHVTAFLENHPPKPFFAAAGFYKPHLPWHVPKRFFDLYDIERLKLPLVKDDDLEDVPPIGKEWALSPRDHELVTARSQWPQAVQGYLAAISYVDELIGRLVETLERSGLAGDTCIVLWGDNGFHLGEKLHWRKFALWEEATRVPLIVVPAAGSGFAPRRVYEPVSLVDVYPTILDLAGLHERTRIDGISLTPYLAKASYRRIQPAIMTWGRGNHSVRTSDWRLTRYADGQEELYDHRVDHYEWTNLALDGAFDAVRDGLRRWIPQDG